MAGGAVPKAAVLVSLLLLLATGPLAAQVDSCGHFGGEQRPDYMPPESDDVLTANRFIEAVRDGDIAYLAEIIEFPLRREYPLPYLGRDEFVARYDEIYGDEFAKLVVSSPTICGRIGWRGLQLQSGLVWFYDDRKVRSINYESVFERGTRLRLIDLERSELHESLREYITPVLEWETYTYRIRIDSTNAGLRYASWKVDSVYDSRPDIVIYDGTWHSEGTIGFHSYYFQNGEYKYIVYVGNGDSTLEVYRTDLSDYYDVRYRSEDDELLLVEGIVSEGITRERRNASFCEGVGSRYQERLGRLRMCFS